MIPMRKGSAWEQGINSNKNSLSFYLSPSLSLSLSPSISSYFSLSLSIYQCLCVQEPMRKGSAWVQGIPEEEDEETDEEQEQEEGGEGVQVVSSHQDSDPIVEQFQVWICPSVIDLSFAGACLP